MDYPVVVTAKVIRSVLVMAGMGGIVEKITTSPTQCRVILSHQHTINDEYAGTSATADRAREALEKAYASQGYALQTSAEWRRAFRVERRLERIAP